MRMRSVALALLVPLAFAAVAEAEFVVRLLPEEQEGGVPVEPPRVVWSSEPGVRYELQESTDLTQPRSSTTCRLAILSVSTPRRRLPGRIGRDASGSRMDRSIGRRCRPS